MKKLRIAALILLLLSLFVSIDLGFQFFYNLVPELMDGYASHSVMQGVFHVFGDQGWTLARFYFAFEKAVWVTFALLVVLENVGNLVCPAEFDTGAVKNAMILSVPEGHDKPLKYPLIFTVCDVLLINKIDVLPYFDFDLEKVREYAHMRNPRLKIFPISAKTGEGMDAWTGWLKEQVRDWTGD